MSGLIITRNNETVIQFISNKPILKNYLDLYVTYAVSIMFTSKYELMIWKAYN